MSRLAKARPDPSIPSDGSGAGSRIRVLPPRFRGFQTSVIDIRRCLPHLSSLWLLSSTANIEKQLKSYGELTDIIITRGNGYSWTGWVPA